MLWHTAPLPQMNVIKPSNFLKFIIQGGNVVVGTMTEAGLLGWIKLYRLYGA